MAKDSEQLQLEDLPSPGGRFSYDRDTRGTATSVRWERGAPAFTVSPVASESGITNGSDQKRANMDVVADSQRESEHDSSDNLSECLSDQVGNGMSAPSMPTEMTGTNREF